MLLENDHVVTRRLKKSTRLADPKYPNRRMTVPERSRALTQPVPAPAHLIPCLGHLMHSIPHPAHQIQYLVRSRHPMRHPYWRVNQRRPESSAFPQLRFREDVAQALIATVELTHCG